MSGEETTSARNEGSPSQRLSVLTPTPAARAASTCVPPARRASAARSRCLKLAVTHTFSGNSPFPLNWTTRMGSPRIRSTPHAYWARTAQTAQQPDLERIDKNAPLLPRRRSSLSSPSAAATERARPLRASDRSRQLSVSEPNSARAEKSTRRSKSVESASVSASRARRAARRLGRGVLPRSC